MKAALKIKPEDYILSVLSEEERLDAAFNVARAAFAKTKLTLKGIMAAVKAVRRKSFKEAHAKSGR
jgi:hypothetical protein